MVENRIGMLRYSPWVSLARRYQLNIFKTLTASAALLSAALLLAGCGHGLINRLI
jgi:hypothetical protein